MAKKVLFEIEVDAKFDELAKMQQEVNKLEAEQKKLGKTSKKNGVEYQKNADALRKVKTSMADTRKEMKNTSNAVKDTGNSYRALIAQNAQLSSDLRKISDPLGKNKKLFNETAAAINNNTNKLKKMDAAMGRSQRHVGDYGRGLGGLGKSFVSSGVAALGMVGGVQLLFSAIGDGFNTIKEFEQAGANLKSVLGDLATDGNIAALSKDAKDLGASTAFSATEVRGLQTEFAKLGFKPKEIINATKATLDLAAATGTDLAEAAEVAGATLGGFGLNASETGRVADVMAKSFSISALDMEKFKESMKNASSSAKTVGQSIEQTTAQLATLAKAGITGSKAGSNLSTGFINLAAKGKTVKDVFAELAGKTGLERLNAAVSLVGKNAAKSFVILADGQETTKDFKEQLDDSAGAAEAMAKIQLDTLDGALKILSSSYEGLILSIEDGTGGMAEFAKIVVQDVSTALSLLGGNLDAADEKLSYLSIVITQVKIQFNIFKNVIKLLTLPLQFMWKAAVKIAEKFGIMQGATDGVGSSLLNIQQIFVRLPEIIDIVVKGITNSFLGLGRVVIELGKAIGNTFSIDTIKAIAAGENPLKNAFAKVSNAAADVFADGIGKVKGEIEDLFKEKENKVAEEEAIMLGETLGKAMTKGVKKSLSTLQDTIKKSIEADEKLKKLKVRFKIKVDASKEGQGNNEFIAGAEKQLEDEKARIKKAEAEKLALRKEIANQTIDLAKQTSDAIFKIQAQNDERRTQQQLDNLTASNQLENDLLESQLEQGSITQAEYENNRLALADETARKELEIKKEAFSREKKLQTAQAIINGAIAITKTIAQLGGVGAITPPGIAMLGGIALSTGIQVATIQSQKFAKGGVLQGASHDNGGIPFTVDGKQGFEAEGGETLINKNSSKMYARELDYINRAGGGVSLFEKGGYVSKFANGGNLGATTSDINTQSQMLMNQLQNIKVVNVATETAAVNNNTIKIDNEFTF